MEKELSVPEKNTELQLQEVAQILDKAGLVVHKNYLDTLNTMEVVPCPEHLKNLKFNDLARFFKIERLVSEKNEDARSKLVSVFHAVASFGCSVLILIHSDGEKVNYYIGTKTVGVHDIDTLDNATEVLEKTLEGNFPGTHIVNVTEGNVLNELLDAVFVNKKFSKQEKHICTITGIAGLRSEEETQEKQFVQGLEKLVDSMQGERYSFLIVADPVDKAALTRMRTGYENFYTNISHLAATDLTVGRNEGTSHGENRSNSHTDSVNKSVSDTLSYTRGTSTSYTETSSGDGWSESETHGTERSKTKGHTDALDTGSSDTNQKGSSDETSQGKNVSIQLSRENKTIKNLLEKIDLQLERLDKSADLGMWNCAAYCFSDYKKTCNMAASLYQSLLRGENSALETSSIIEWDKQKTAEIRPYLKKMHHPEFLLNLSGYGETVTPSSCISGAELAIHAGLPQKGVSGLPVVQMVSFGRETVKDSTAGRKKASADEPKEITLGKVFHMGRPEHLSIHLDQNKLCEHVFVTGSTGTGKSNTTYHLMGELRKQGIHFLVIEPTKGEYKNVFGGSDDVAVFGTNPKLTPLLRINPFAFPDDILVTEHIERLTEIFNVCWPMEAAMPAVLKDAIIESYQTAGWDLTNSISALGIFPTFLDVMRNIEVIMNRSDYSDENKGNYKAALITRLKSLTTGIYGMIFTKDAIPTADLFDRNVIVDLSRVGSTDTKALIMGILMIQLQEHRLASRPQDAAVMNEAMRHVTVLEEAHNLLKRTSTEQSADSANLVGKAVEMLANAIAEMRTFGEGFVIVDQSPGLLDMSVIRNTNTKIIHKLPDKGDRDLVGLSAMLNEDQIIELARLPQGVAGVYQSNWIEPVLCQVAEYKKVDYKPFKFQAPPNSDDSVLIALKKRIAEFILSGVTGNRVNTDPAALKAEVLHSSLNDTTLIRNIVAFIDKNRFPAQVDLVVYPLIAGLYSYPDTELSSLRVCCEASKEDLEQQKKPRIEDWFSDFVTSITPDITHFDTNLKEAITVCLTTKIKAGGSGYDIKSINNLIQSCLQSSVLKGGK